MRTFIHLSLFLTLSISHLTLATDDSSNSDSEENSIVRSRIHSIGSKIPVKPPVTQSVESHSLPTTPRNLLRKFSFKSNSSFIKKDHDKDDSSSSNSSPRSSSPKKPDTHTNSPSGLIRPIGFSYTSGSSSNLRSSSSPSLSQIDSQPSSSFSEDNEVKSPRKHSDSSKPDSIKSPRSRTSSSSKKEILFSEPVAKIPFATIKDPEAELEELLKKALSLCKIAFEPLSGSEQDSNERVELVVKPMLQDLKNSILNITTKKEQSSSILDAKLRAQKLGDPVSFFRMTVNRAMTQIPSAVKWALKQPSENFDLIKYFEKMLENAQKTQEAMLQEHNTTKFTLMNWGQALYLELVKQWNVQKEKNIEDRRLVVDNFLKEYTTYLNGMHDQLKHALGEPTLFNALNREFNPTIHSMHTKLLKVFDWAVGKEDKIDLELKAQFTSKLNELTAPLSTSEISTKTE